jgi:2-polyprenyl-3-methyl-5-hydroxy-6-metoxy-1,4-benzoquinol methylase
VIKQELCIEKNSFFCRDTSGLESHSFDVITMWHVFNLYEQIKELKRLLNPGTLIVAVLILNPSMQTLRHFLGL